MYNVVSTCAYANTPDRVEQQSQWQQSEKELEDKGYSKDDIDQLEKNWKLLRGKRFFLKDSFDFKIETIGVYTNMELVHLAIDSITKRLTKINEICQNDKLIMEKNKTTMSNTVDITLENEDYTIGKVIEYLLHEMYFKKQKILSYVGFIKKHPHDDYSIIRVVFADEDKSNIDNIKSLIYGCVDKAKQIFNSINESFV